MQLKENEKIRVVPENFEETFDVVINKIDDDYVYFNLGSNVLGAGEVFDAYVISDNGILFFTAKVEKIEDNVVSFGRKIKLEQLQRRQYVRVKIVDDVEIFNNENEKLLDAWFVDISVGGFKIHLKNTLNFSQKYLVKFKLYEKDMILPFSIIAQNKEMENLYTISARFENISNNDKITLVQYCYKKQAVDIEE